MDHDNNGRLPLRPSDLGSRHGHIIHYHRDKHSQRAHRHIHYHPPVKRSHQTDSLNTFLRAGGTSTNLDAIYEVPSNRQFRREQTVGMRELDVKIRSLANSGVDGRLDHQSPAKAKALTGSSITLHGQTSHQPIVPFKTKIVRHPSFHDVHRNYPVTTDANSRIGNVQFLNKRRKQKLLYNKEIANDNYEKGVNKTNTNTVVHKNTERLNTAKNNHSGNVNSLVMGMFHQYQANEYELQNKTLKQPIHRDVSINTEVPGTSENYQHSTAHSKPITKRRVQDEEPKTHKTLIDNVLKIQIGDTTTLPSVPYYGKPVMSVSVTQASQKPMTTERTGVILDTKTTVGPTPQQISAKDFIHLKGIHIAFSNGQQNKSKTIPTIHLTASLSPPGKPSKASTSIQSAGVDKIVGTAMIKNGHLYLVVYPLRDNNSIDMMFLNDSSKVQLPHNKPSSYTKDPAIESTTLFPSTTITTAREFTSATETTTVLTTSMELTSTTSEDLIADTTTAETLETTIDPLEAFVSDFLLNDFLFDTSTVSEHNHKPKVRNGTLEIKHVERFFSPWRDVNLTEVVPFPISKNNESTKVKNDDETDLEIFNFIANATDPFDKVKAVLEKIKNSSVINSSTEVMNDTNAEAAFNFELKVQRNVVHSTLDPKRYTTQSVSENSEEIVETTIKPTTELIKLLIHKKPSAREKSKMESVTGSLLEKNLKDNDTTQGTSEPSLSKEEMRTTTPVLTNVMETSTPSPNKKSQFTDSILFPATSSTENVYLFGSTYGTQSTTNTLFDSFNKHQPTTLATGATVSTTTVAPQITPPSFNLLSAINPRHWTDTGENAVQGGSPQEVKSLSDILNDIRRIQLHNMARFNAQNNNFDTMLARQSPRQSDMRPSQRAGVMLDGPVYPDTSARRFASQNNNIHNRQHINIHEQTAINNALDAMLVLSVDEFLADHTNLHGALILASRASSNNQQE
ncbi:hypothetical protein MAR_025089 [Mya arenaria]|uniref:Uncharacterized protein n=1 Tax=Mya arenaria TaxID=6604 RepID=A0ABY7DVS2_MYAAR|nr:hypothetical protein MAR_025089 [Mya arenaria]